MNSPELNVPSRQYRGARWWAVVERLRGVSSLRDTRVLSTGAWSSAGEGGGRRASAHHGAPVCRGGGAPTRSVGGAHSADERGWPRTVGNR